MKETMQIVRQLKESGQDYEFYPTTEEIVKVIARDIEREGYSYEILDIGAGNGSFFKLFEEKIKDKDCGVMKYAIEKSGILLKFMPADVFVIGTDFHSQTLIDKQIEIIFCNPPYREFEEWTKRIIKGSNSKVAYLVIPCRWKENKEIKELIKRRGADVKVIGSFDFLNSEFREARAKVDIVKIKFSRHYSEQSDPFDIWFEEFFKFTADKEKEGKYARENKKAEEIKKSIVKGQNLIERLEELYNKDFQNLLNNYRQIEQLDKNIFKELNVDIASIREGLKLRIKGLKNLYWQELFNNLDTITSRLTADSRKKMFRKLTENTTIDFTADNAYQIVLWVIKNANDYINEQLVEVYLWMSKTENIINYKSNKKVFEKERWRFNAKEHTVITS
jgi:hypothetical protein